MASPERNRRDPDALLAQLEHENARAKQGKLRIYFGASAGVGKTYAMLLAARKRREEGRDVLLGVVETHGRSETAALLEGLVLLPAKELDYKGNRLREFDLDAAIARHPELLLVDELAHTNAPGSRHPKRYQDVEELLAAGIDVYTTVNVQHLESLNDVVGGITGIRVNETLPDRVFDEADEIVLVDLPPDELLNRLREGKVYMPDQAQHAVKNFFRKGNLIALRELALRQAADRVDDQMREYRVGESIEQVWKTRDGVLACVGPRPGAERTVRSASRLAKQLDAPWHAVYVETPELQRLSENERARILKILRLAHELGAQTATLPGQSAVDAIIDYCARHNLSKVMVGRNPNARVLGGMRRISFADRMIQASPELEIIQAPSLETDGPQKGFKADSSHAPHEARAGKSPAWTRYAWTVGYCAIATAIAWPLPHIFAPVNIAMLFLLAVVLAAVRHGRGPAVLASLLGVVSFDFFFVDPRFSFDVSDAQYLITFFVMLVVGLITGQLTAGLRYQARVAAQRESRVRALVELARELSAALVPEQIASISNGFVQASFGAKAALLLMSEQDRLLPPVSDAEALPAGAVDMGVAQWVFDHGEPAGLGTDTLPGSAALYLPLRAPMRTRGVLAVQPAHPRWLLVPEQQRQLETFAALAAVALERVHYVDVAQKALVRMESERLRNSLLAAVSHDLRTPLTALMGLADTLSMIKPPLPPAQREIADAIRAASKRVSAMVNNLLDMARIEAGSVRINKQWQTLEEIIGAAIEANKQTLHAHVIRVDDMHRLPLIEYDAMLLERVFSNLLENAVKYTPRGSTISIGAVVHDDAVEISVFDNGPGFAAGSEASIFDKFTRGATESATSGVGLGLAVSKAIVEAHGGRMWAERPDDGGARFVFTLPLGHPPNVDLTTEEAELSADGQAANRSD
ncbi:MAG: two-component system sensor histidine kinase KdpD [Betaproteobacteria bacterium]